MDVYRSHAVDEVRWPIESNAMVALQCCHIGPALLSKLVHINQEVHANGAPK